MKPRVFVLGLDGADQFTLGRAVRDGLMPALSRLVGDRLRPLRSTPLPITPAAWTAAYTGYNPGKTGVLTFQRRLPNTYRGRIVNSSDVGANGFYTRLAGAGKNVISIGFPMMSPPPESPASIVSGWDSPPGVPLVNHSSMTPVLDRFGLRIDDEFETSAAVLAKGIEARFSVLKEFMGSTDWDCAMLYLGFIDSLGHRLGSGNSETRELLAKTDRELSAVADALPDDTSFIVCSDHGFGQFNRSFSTMQWLEERGFLTLRSRSFRSAAAIPGVDVMDLETGVIDWSNTRAFCWEAVGRRAAISLNLRGDYPNGVVSPREAFALSGEIIEALRATNGPDGTPLVTQAWRREELFWGPKTSEFPEIFFETAEDVTAFVGKRARVEGGFDLENGIVHHGPFNSHHEHGIWGTSFVCGDEELFGVEDLAPTVYALLGEPIPEDCDGANRSPKRSLVGAAAAGNAAPVYSADEEEIVRKRLEDLGYL